MTLHASILSSLSVKPKKETTFRCAAIKVRVGHGKSSSFLSCFTAVVT